MKIVTREEWGARKPKSILRTTWGKRTGFMVHYSGASPSQTPRIIQDFHMNTRGWSDVGYNFLVSSTSGVIYEGRGWLVVGAHAAGVNIPNIGVCVIGNDNVDRQDVSDHARASVKWLFQEGQRLKQGSLSKRYHSMVGATDCPGDELREWVRAGMPVGYVPLDMKRDWTKELIMTLPLLKTGSQGAMVSRLQGLLHANGQRASAIDGDFGSKTEKAVRAFQAKAKIDADGVVWRKTWTALLGQ